jgi:hypothetical protein
MPSSQWFPKLLKSCYVLGAYPEELKVPVTPVDFVTKSIFSLSLKDGMDSNIFHLMNSREVSLGAIFENAVGVTKAISKVTAGEWLGKVAEAAKSDPLPITPWIDPGLYSATNGKAAAIKVPTRRGYCYSAELTLKILQEVNIRFPEEEAYLDKYLQSALLK